MLTNFHTHTTFCDGKNTPREIVQKAISLRYKAIGFSGHGFTPFDTRYCMKDLNGYVAEINALKAEFYNDIEIYLGVEEDAFAPVNRAFFDYVIGSCHYYHINGKYYPIDSSKEAFLECVQLFNGNANEMADVYYDSFCNYILKRKPDIIGHFDLITKYDEIFNPLFLTNESYHELSKKYVKIALKADCVFEVNCGAIIKNYRTKPYPFENLLYTINKEGGKITLSLDCHSVDALEFDFSEVIKTLKSIGFNETYTLSGGKLIKERL